MIVVRALYALRSAGATFRAFLGEHLYDKGFRSSQADPDVWLKPRVNQVVKSTTNTPYATWMMS
jgi:hypothetical protein